VAAHVSGQQTIDITYSTSPARIGGLDTPGTAAGVVVENNVAYVADRFSGLRTIDVSNPAAPQNLGFVDTPGSAYAVALAGSMAYVADNDAGLEVIDVSNPASPQIVGTANTPGYAVQVAVAGNFAYVCDYSSLQIVDVSIPSSPQIVGSASSQGPSWGVAVRTAAAARDGVPQLRGSGDYAVMVGEGWLQVYDVSDPWDPQEVVSMPVDGFNVTFSNGFAFVAAGRNGILIFELSEGGNPVLVGDLPTPGYATAVAVLGSELWVADDVGGIGVFDVDTGGFLGSYNSLGEALGIVAPPPLALRAADAVVYVADGSAGLLVLPSQCSAATGANEWSAATTPRPGLEVFPNPAARGTIRFATPRAGDVAVSVHDVAGRRLRDVFRGPISAGDHTLDWDGISGTGRPLAAGVYFVRLEAPGLRETRRITVLR
jgi:hypothetical protein